ncbi:TfuA-like protein [Streptomyces sp. PR69]|uniref:TfuA-like protein n=1 Tax=Streptomyces sp. PR69 TaxID=2984950 RepID=UPI0022647D07|nr:TfuA-like protein [Streptomyces sp. PR69]
MIHVYVGPTLPRHEPLLTVPGVRLRPPVRHGDLFDEAIAESDTVVLIDGVYHQVPAVRHKEILALMSRGVRVVGAASIGALRAAELCDFGMVGVGRVFAAYACGDLVGDDEVAVGQEPGAEMRALTWPLVNVRHVLGAAEREGVMTNVMAVRLLTLLRAVYYPQRTTAAVRAVSLRYGAADFAAWLAERRRADRHFGDLKRLDALEAVQTALDGIPSAAGSLSEARPETCYYRRWANHFETERVNGREVPTLHRLAYQQIFDPHFPGVWDDYLEHLSRHADSPGQSVAAEAAGKIFVPACILFRPPVDLRDKGLVRRLLTRETEADRAAVVRYLACNDQAGTTWGAFSAEAVDERATRSTLLRLWRCDPDELEGAAAARGFRSAAQAVGSMKHFMAGLLHDQAGKIERGPTSSVLR